MLSSKQKIGKEIENLACAYLQQRGLRLIVANYPCKVGEVDLIMSDDQTLVFIEVRYRKNFNYGDGAATVDKNKQRRIIKAATYYLQERNLYDKVLCRFEIVAVSGVSKYELDWIKDAFWVKW